MSPPGNDRTEARRAAYRNAAKAADAKKYRFDHEHLLVPDESGTEWVLEKFLESIKPEKADKELIGNALTKAEQTFSKGYRDAMKELKKTGKGEPVWVLTPDGVKLAFRRA